MTAHPRGLTVWITGPPAAGKTTLASAVRDVAIGPCEVVDGDALRATVNRDLGFSREDRATSCSRACDVALDLAGSGAWAIVAHVSPYRSDRLDARRRHQAAGVDFIEVHLSTPLAVRVARDPKGLYESARLGRLAGLTGYDAPYEEPLEPELRLEPGDTHEDAAVVLALACDDFIGRGSTVDRRPSGRGDRG